MRDLKHPAWMYGKAALFVAAGLLASALLLIELPTLRVALLLCLATWCFCRAYYFVFYVIERYIDPSYRFSGVFSFVLYLLRKRRGNSAAAVDAP